MDDEKVVTIVDQKKIGIHFYNKITLLVPQIPVI